MSLGDTPPSSDSGIHSLEEQWENMSISVVYMESEQNGRPTNGSPTGQRGSDTRVPPNTEEEEDINCPWMDCLLEGNLTSCRQLIYQTIERIFSIIV